MVTSQPNPYFGDNTTRSTKLKICQKFKKKINADEKIYYEESDFLRNKGIMMKSVIDVLSEAGLFGLSRTSVGIGLVG